MSGSVLMRFSGSGLHLAKARNWAKATRGWAAMRGKRALAGAMPRKNLEEAAWWVPNHGETDESQPPFTASPRDALKECHAALVNQFLPSAQLRKEEKARDEQGIDDYLEMVDEVLAEVQANRAQPTEAQ